MLGRPNHPAPALSIDEAEQEALRALVRAGTTEQRTAMRARVIMAAADGVANERIAAELGVHKMTVLLWRDALPGTAWPGSMMRRASDASRRTAARCPRRPGSASPRSSASGPRLSSRRTEALRFSTDPDLATRVRDVVGLHLAPPERAIVVSLDEKTQIQALDRTQPMLPMRPGQVERHTHDYERNGATCLFAALEVGTGQVNRPDAGASPGRGLPRLPAAGGVGLPRWRAARHPRQRQHPQDAGCPGLARSEPPDHVPLHPDLGVLDEPGRDVVRHPHPAGHTPQQLPLGQGSRRPDRGLHVELECRGLALHLGQDRRRDPRQGRPQAASDQRIRALGLLRERGRPRPGGLRNACYGVKYLVAPCPPRLQRPALGRSLARKRARHAALPRGRCEPALDRATRGRQGDAGGRPRAVGGRGRVPDLLHDRGRARRAAIGPRSRGAGQRRCASLQDCGCLSSVRSATCPCRPKPPPPSSRSLANGIFGVRSRSRRAWASRPGAGSSTTRPSPRRCSIGCFIARASSTSTATATGCGPTRRGPSTSERG